MNLPGFVDGNIFLSYNDFGEEPENIKMRNEYEYTFFYHAEKRSGLFI